MAIATASAAAVTAATAIRRCRLRRRVRAVIARAKVSSLVDSVPA